MRLQLFAAGFALIAPLILAFAVRAYASNVPVREEPFAAVAVWPLDDFFVDEALVQYVEKELLGGLVMNRLGVREKLSKLMPRSLKDFLIAS